MALASYVIMWEETHASFASMPPGDDVKSLKYHTISLGEQCNSATIRTNMTYTSFWPILLIIYWHIVLPHPPPSECHLPKAPTQKVSYLSHQVIIIKQTLSGETAAKFRKLECGLARSNKNKDRQSATFHYITHLLRPWIGIVWIDQFGISNRSDTFFGVLQNKESNKTPWSRAGEHCWPRSTGHSIPCEHREEGKDVNLLICRFKIG